MEDRYGELALTGASQCNLPVLSVPGPILGPCCVVIAGQEGGVGRPQIQLKPVRSCEPQGQM